MIYFLHFTVFFEMIEYAVNESDSLISVCVLLSRPLGLEDSVTLTLSTADRSATGRFQINSRTHQMLSTYITPESTYIYL